MTVAGRSPACAAARAFLVAAVSLPVLASLGAPAPAPTPPVAQPPAATAPLNSQPPPNVVNTPVPPPAQSVVPQPADQTSRPLTASEAAQIALARQPSIAAASG